MSVTQINVYVADRAAADRIVSTSEDGGVTVDGAAIGEFTGDENPFKGLDAFDEADAERFYGRTTITDRLWQALGDLTAAGADAPRLLPILGPSGSGKSSIARAGLIPALARQPLDGLQNPRIVYLTPRAHPLAELALVLARIEPGERHPATVAAEFERLLRQPDPDGSGRMTGLRRIADSLTQAAERALVILVDQFEELFVLSGSEDERRLFIDGLLEAVGDPGGRVSAILTMRSDFLGATMSHRGLNALIAAHGVIVPTMTDSELRETIEAPAMAAGRPLPPGVVDRLVDETEDRAGALPLLQFALSRIWDGMVAGQEAGQTLRDIGGVGGALAGRAEALFQELDPAERAVAKRAFLATVSLGEGARDTRRRARLAEIVPADADPVAVKDVVAGFARKHERLMTIAGTGDEITIEVTHEAIFDHWTRLDDWLAQEREDLRFQRRLSDAVTSWDTAEPPRPSGGLWRHPALDRLAEFHAVHKTEMTALQLAFFDASRRHDRWARLFRLGGVAATVLAIMAGGFGWYAWEKRAEARLAADLAELAAKDAQDQRNAARLAADRAERIQSSFLADMARQQTAAGDAALGALLASAALGEGREVVPAAEVALLGSLVEMHEILGARFGEPVLSVRIGANGRYALAIVLQNRYPDPHPSAVVIDAATGETIPLPYAVGASRSATLHPIEPLIAIAGNGLVALYNLETGDLDYELNDPIESDSDWSRFQIVFSPDGRYLVAFSHSSTHAWDLVERRFLGARRIPTMTSWGPRLRFSGDRILVSQGNANTVAEWPLQEIIYHNDADGVEGGALSPDGRILVELRNRSPVFYRLGISGDEPKRMEELWRDSSGSPREYYHQVGYEDIRNVAFSPAGSALIASGLDGVSYWFPLSYSDNFARVVVDRPLALAPNPDLVQRAVDERNGSGSEFRDGRISTTRFAISPSGRHLAVGGFYGEIAIWAVRANDLPRRIAVLSAHGPGNAILTLEFSADGERLISSGADGTVRVWAVAVAGTHAIDSPYGSIVEGFIAANGEEVELRRADDWEDAWRVSAIAFSPDGRLVVTGGGHQGHTDVWDSVAGTHVATLQGHSNWVHRAQFTDDGARLMTSGEDGEIIFWDVATWELLHRIGGGGLPGLQYSNPWDAILSPDETEILAFGETTAIGIWGLDGAMVDYADPAGSGQFDDFTIEILDAGYLEGEAIALLRIDNNDESLILWDVRDDRVLDEITVADVTRSRFEFVSAISQDMVALAHINGVISLWQSAALKIDEPLQIKWIADLPGHRGSRIEALAFSADRRSLASAASDGRVKLWDMERMVEIGDLFGADAPAEVVALSADGSFAAAGFRWSRNSGGLDQLKIWHIPVGRDALIAEVEARRIRDLTAAERRRFYVDLP